MKNSELTSYYVLHPQTFKLDGGAMFGIIPKPLWNKVHESDSQNRIELALRLLLIKKEGRNILIDASIGDYHDEKFQDRFAVSESILTIEKTLSKINLTPDSITDIIISHLHFDHVGGLGGLNESNSQTPIFKNAILHLHKDHFEYAKNPTDRDLGSFHQKTFLPLINWYESKNQIKFYHREKGELFCGLKFICSMGHTPFLMHPFDEKVIYMSDLIPTSNHVSIPWVMGYDISPGITTKDKKEFLEFILKNNLTMIFEHDPKYIGAKITKNEKEEYKLKDFILQKEVADEIYLS